MMQPHLRYAAYAFAALLALLGQRPASAQPFGIEWIDFGQEYFKITVQQDGIYRIGYQELVQGGFPVSSTDPRTLQLWFRGQQRAIWIEGEADGRFDEGDYIEFYGQANDAQLDAELYDRPEHVPNPFMNLYSDRTAYFLTASRNGSFGRRMEFFYESNTSLPTVPYVMATDTIAMTRSTNAVSQGALYPSYLPITSSGVHTSAFTSAKGFVGFPVGGSTTTMTRTRSFPLGPVASANVPVRMDLRVVGYSNGPHLVSFYLGEDAASGQPLGQVALQGYAMKDTAIWLTPAQLQAANSTLHLTVVAEDASPYIELERVGFGYILLHYPMQPSKAMRAREVFTLPVNEQGRSRLLLDQPAPNTRLYDATDWNNMRRIGSDLVGGRVSAVINRTQSERRLLLASGYLQISGLEAIDLRPVPNRANYLLVSHRDLTVPAGQYDNPVQAYADYRASAAGGGYQVYAADIDMLYNLFSYGEVTPLAVRRLIRYLENRGNAIQQLFLVGKALERNYQYERNLPASGSWTQRNMVPCMGMPCSDALYTARLHGEADDVSSIPVGRLSALNATHVANYLDKVKEHEARPFNSLDRKNTMFLSGGATNLERSLLRSYTQQFADLTEGTYLGGKARVYAKQTTSSVELFDVSNDVNEGLQLITLFGHTAVNFTDIEIGHPGGGVFDYRNKGKYPMMIVNGCNSGDVYLRDFSLGERWTVAAEAGAVGYIAHSDLGYPSKLRYHTLRLLEALYTDSLTIHRTVGEALVRAQRNFIDIWPYDPIAVAQLHQYTFQGDPAVKFFSATEPDYAVDNAGPFVETAVPGQPVTADADAFRIGIPVSNLGVTREEPLRIAVKRSFNGGAGGEKWYPEQTFPAVYYRDTLYYDVAVTEEDKANAVGINRFEVHVDYGNRVDELQEGNNIATFEFVFPRSAVRLLSPAPYAIVSSQPVKLQAQNLDMLPREREYIFQLDTTDAFNSPFLREQPVTASFAPSWTVPSLISDNAADSLVYYWRVRFAAVGELDSDAWAQGSFIYVKNSPQGWAQRDYEQFKEAALERLVPVETGSQWAFQTDTVRVSMKTVGGAGAWADQFIKVDDIPITEEGRCGQNYLLVLSIDYETGQVYNRMEGINVFAACGFYGTLKPLAVVGAPRTAPPMIDYMFRNTIDSGDYVFIMSSRNIPFNFLRDADRSALERLGIPRNTLGEVVQAGYPVIMMGRLDVPEFEPVIITADPNNDTVPANQQEIFADFVLPIRQSLGTVLSSKIGPAKAWGQASRQFGPPDGPADGAVLDLVGVRPDGVETVIRSNLGGLEDLSKIDALQYPYLRLKASFADNRRNTPQGVRHWQVAYQPQPEGLLHYEGGTANFEKPLAFGEGEDAAFDFRFEHIGGAPFDQPVVFQYTLRKPDNTVLVGYDTLAALPEGGFLSYRKTLGTLGLAGKNLLTVFANPLAQPEWLYDNNILQREFEVRPDRVNPVLDVAFDGVRIMDGDIVSPTPLISIGLTDENPYYTLSDTATVLLQLAGPDGEFRDIPTVGNAAVQWVEQGENALRLEFSPERLDDGRYRLRVQAKDASGNLSGAQPYEVGFEVVNASQITHFYPYPNPFSTQVRFVFTLTGAVLPDDIRIQIMTVTGRVVREISQEELGPIRIGHNISQYAWDGRDEYGDQLANGTYLYRVVVQAAGQDMERRATANDGLFKHGIGKLYLLR